MFDTTGFGWQVLRTLVDEIVTHPAEPSGGPSNGTLATVGIRFVKKALLG
jgi:hypothetical protein